jgi:glycosyltransferase involved in cell wall biosynthesis
LTLRSILWPGLDHSRQGIPLNINGRFLDQTLSGVQRFAYEIARELVVLWPETDKVPTVLRPPGGTVEHPSFSIQTVGQRSGVLWEQLDLPRHASGSLLLNLANTAPLWGKHRAVVIHDMGAFETPQAYSTAFRTYYQCLQRMMARTGITVVTVSEFSRSAIAKHLGIPETKIAVIGEGADHMHRLQSDPETLARHQLTSGAYVLAVGNLSQHKNLTSLVAVASMLERRGVPLVIAGQANPIFHSGGLTLPNPARYLGRVSDAELKALYAGAACFVCPSLYEGFGLPAIEAMACGCVVLASDIPGLRETCGDSALFVDPRSPEDISAKVARVLDEPTFAERIRHAGMARASELTWARSARLLKAALLPEPACAAVNGRQMDRMDSTSPRKAQ